MDNQLPESDIPQNGSEKTENIFEVVKKSKVPKWARLVVLVLGVVALVVGGVVWYYSDLNQKQITKDYYQELTDKCGFDSCCARSVETMRSNGYKQISIDGCPKGLEKNQLRCANSYSWCEPIAVSQKPPKLPVIHLRYQEKVYEGLKGSYCWPITKELPGGEAETLCADTIFQDPSDVISVTAGDTLAIETEAQKPPEGLIAHIFKSDEPPIQSVRLDTNFVVPFTVNLPADVYIIQIAGDWPEGDVIYTFKIAVSDACGPEPPAECAAGMSLTCLDGKWDCRKMEQKIEENL